MSQLARMSWWRWHRDRLGRWWNFSFAFYQGPVLTYGSRIEP